MPQGATLIRMRPSSPQKLLSQAGTPAFLISNLINIRYLTGMPLSAGLLLVTPRRMQLFVDARYTDLAERSARNVQVRPLDDCAKALGDAGECGFEADDVTVMRFIGWKRKYKNTKFIRKTGVVEGFRRQKDADELPMLRRAHRMTRELLRRVPSALRTRTTEEKLARQLLIWALELGADGLAFDPIVAFGTHTSSPHHHPTARALQKGHLVQIDVGVRHKGYCGDMSEVYFTAPATPLQKRLYATLQEAKLKAMQAARAGTTNHALDRIARDVLRRDGVEDAFTHSLGHGVGLEVHEGLSLSQKSPKKPLLAGEVIAIEPGVYFSGKFGMRVEDMIMVQ